MKNYKYCPLLAIKYYYCDDGCGKENLTNVQCQGNKCAWWVEMFSTENILQEGMCAICAMAVKNSEGKIPV